MICKTGRREQEIMFVWNHLNPHRERTPVTQGEVLPLTHSFIPIQIILIFHKIRYKKECCCSICTYIYVLSCHWYVIKYATEGTGEQQLRPHSYVVWSPSHSDPDSYALSSNVLAGRDTSAPVQPAMVNLAKQGHVVPGGGVPILHPCRFCS